ncbi:MAG: fructosamine kinase family protein, partial [Rivularia sp. ALOHA_DT_140]|nr:fructosamine kinase family protein [Rivularia sp. ALOHA_DT_140]
MWTEIDNQITQATDEKFQTQQRKSVSGGCINQGYSLSNGNKTYFVKLNQASQVAMFEAEALGVKQMYDTNTIRVPKPICYGVSENSCYIVLEWLDMGRGDSKASE